MIPPKLNNSTIDPNDSEVNGILSEEFKRIIIRMISKIKVNMNKQLNEFKETTKKQLNEIRKTMPVYEKGTQ
jgi:hypothetical protein